MYATTSYTVNDWYLGFSQPFSDRQFYLDQLRIIEGLEDLARQFGWQVTVKLHPTTEHEEPPWADGVRVRGHLDVVRGSPSFSELLRLADTVVLDFGSTTLFQALAAGSRVFVLLRYVRFPQDAEARLRERATACHDAESLVRALARSADGHDDGGLQSAAFLAAYGTHLDDGRSAQRAISVLRTVVDVRSVDAH